MFDIAPSAGQIRKRLDWHLAAQTCATLGRDQLIANRAKAGALLTDTEIDEIDHEIARLNDIVERASSRVELLRPAVAAAEASEAADETRRRDAAERQAFAETRSGTLEAASGNRDKARVAAQAVLAARAPSFEYSGDFFNEKPAPRASYGGDETWWRDREARLRREGTVAPDRSAPEPVFSTAGFGPHNIR